jgi:hypothetical protein
MARRRKKKAAGKALAAAPESSAPDPFVELSLETWRGLSAAVRELGWIADGGEPSASMGDRDLAALKRIQFDRERVRIMERLTAYYDKKTSVKPPSTTDLEQAKKIATRLAEFAAVSVKAKAVVDAGTALLNIYAKA